MKMGLTETEWKVLNWIKMSVDRETKWLCEESNAFSGFHKIHRTAWPSNY